MKAQVQEKVVEERVLRDALSEANRVRRDRLNHLEGICFF